MVFNATYSPAKSNVLMINPLPLVSLAYLLIMPNDQQRKVSVHSHFLRNIASYCVSNHKVVGSSDLKEKKSNLVCSHCKKFVHLIDKCYKTIGFQIDFKFTRFKKMHENVRIMQLLVLEKEIISLYGHSFRYWSVEQKIVSQLTQLHHKIKVSQTETTTLDVNANFVGKLFDMYLSDMFIGVLTLCVIFPFLWAFSTFRTFQVSPSYLWLSGISSSVSEQFVWF